MPLSVLNSITTGFTFYKGFMQKSLQLLWYIFLSGKKNTSIASYMAGLFNCW